MFAAGTTKSGIMNDMYRYTPTKDEWIWIPTSSSLTTRDHVGSTSDGTGKAWIFGGEGEPFAGGSTGTERSSSWFEANSLLQAY